MSMRDTTANRFHKLGPESGVVYEESEATASASEGVKDFLDQFEGDEKVDAALRIMAGTAAVLKDELDDERSAGFYAHEIANPETLAKVGEHYPIFTYLMAFAGVARQIS